MAKHLPQGEDWPAPRPRETRKLAGRVHRNWLVGQFEAGQIGCIIRIATDRKGRAIQPRRVQTGLHTPCLFDAPAIFAFDRRRQRSPTPHGFGRHDMLDAKLARDRLRIESMHRRREDEHAALLLLAHDQRHRIVIEIAGKNMIGKGIRQIDRRFPIERAAKHQALHDFLERPAADKTKLVRRHRKHNERHQNQPPWRQPPRAEQKKRGIGAVARNRSIEIDDRHPLRRMSSVRFVPSAVDRFRGSLHRVRKYGRHGAWKARDRVTAVPS